MTLAIEFDKHVGDKKYASWGKKRDSNTKKTALENSKVGHLHHKYYSTFSHEELSGQNFPDCYFNIIYIYLKS